MSPRNVNRWEWNVTNFISVAPKNGICPPIKYNPAIVVTDQEFKIRIIRLNSNVKTSPEISIGRSVDGNILAYYCLAVVFNVN